MISIEINPLKANVLYTGQQEQKDIFTKKEKTIGVQLTKEKDFDHQRVNCAGHEYMNMSPSLIELATPLI